MKAIAKKQCRHPHSRTLVLDDFTWAEYHTSPWYSVVGQHVELNHKADSSCFRK